MPTPKKSDAAHWLAGTKSQAKKEPEYSVAPGRPKMPPGLTAEQQRTFKRIRMLLEKRRACTHGDIEIIRLYSLLYERHAKAVAKIETEGEICVYSRLDSHGKEIQVEKKNLWYDVVRDCEKEMVALLDRLGMSPLNRGKVKPTAGSKEKPVEKTPAELEYELFTNLVDRKGKYGGTDSQAN